MIRNRVSLFVATFLIIGFFFLALPEKGFSGINIEIGGCCQVTEPDLCFNIDSLETLIECSLDNTIAIEAEDCDSTGQCVPRPAMVPTLSEWGLLAMAGILGIVGFIMVIRRRKVTA